MALEVVFTNTSTGDIIASFWDFGDGETSNINNPVHTYSEVGTYSVTLTVYGADGSISSFTEEVVVTDGFAHLFDFTIDEQGFEQALVAGNGVYVPGEGWQTELFSGTLNNFSLHRIEEFSDRVITSFTMFFLLENRVVNACAIFPFNRLYLNGVAGNFQSGNIGELPTGDYEIVRDGFTPALANDFVVNIGIQHVIVPPTAAEFATMYALIVEGEGTDPFIPQAWQQAIDFTVTPYLFTVNYGDYTPGVGWQSVDNGSNQTMIDLFLGTGIATENFTLMRFTFLVNQSVSEQYEVNGAQEILLSGILAQSNPLSPPAQDANGEYTLEVNGFNVDANELAVQLYFDDETEVHALTLVSMYFEGTGTNPFPQYDWEHTIDFTSEDGGFTGLGNYNPGVGWEGVDDGGAVAMGINLPITPTNFVYQSFEIEVARIPDGGGSSDVLARLGGSGGDEDIFLSGTLMNGLEFREEGFTPHITDVVILGLSFGGTVATDGNIIFKSVTYRGNGVNPF